MVHHPLSVSLSNFFFLFFLFMIVTEREREREREAEAETQAEGEAGSMHREPDVGSDPGSPGSRPGPKAGAKPLRHPGIPGDDILEEKERNYSYLVHIRPLHAHN